MSPEEYRENTYLFRPEELDIDVMDSYCQLITLWQILFEFVLLLNIQKNVLYKKQ